MGRGGAKIASGIAGLVWELVEEVCSGIEVVIERDYTVGDRSLRRDVVVVDAEGLIACVAVGMRGSGLPEKWDMSQLWTKS